MTAVEEPALVSISDIVDADARRAREAANSLSTSAAESRRQHAVDISVIVVSYNTAGLLDRMFDALYAACGGLNVEVIVVDNASSDNSVELLRRRAPAVRLIENSVNVGFGRANNQALPLATGRYVLLLNTDAFVSADTLTKTVAYMDANATYGVLGVKLVAPNGALQPSCRYFPTPWNAFLNATGASCFFPKARLVDDLSWAHDVPRACDWVPGCYYLIRRQVIDEVGLFDSRYFLYYEEVDHCRAVRESGWSVVYFPFTSVVHAGGESARSTGDLNGARQISTLQMASEVLYFRKHHGIGGVVLWVGLALVGDVLNVIKRTIRPRRDGTSRLDFSHCMSCIRVLASTRFGSRATR
jgi:N-acetylglucosaminyl-diphospho-decaprenol L-rhamnosyltransferase